MISQLSRLSINGDESPNISVALYRDIDMATANLFEV